MEGFKTLLPNITVAVSPKKIPFSERKAVRIPKSNNPISEEIIPTIIVSRINENRTFPGLNPIAIKVPISLLRSITSVSYTHLTLPTKA